MFGRGKSSLRKRPAFVLWIVEKLSCWAGRKQCPLFLPLKFPDLHGEDVDDFFFFFFLFFAQSSNAILCHFGDYSWTAVRDYSTCRFRKRSGPHDFWLHSGHTVPGSGTVAKIQWLSHCMALKSRVSSHCPPSVINEICFYFFSFNHVTLIVLTRSCINAKSCWHPLPAY